jgi:DNA repair protein RadC
MTYFKSYLPEITLKYKKGDVNRFRVHSSKDLHNVLKNLFNVDTVELFEEFIVIFFNTKLNSIGWFRVSQGGITSTIVDVRLILATALKCAATSIAVAHNHPSGNLQPSQSDIDFTKKLNHACKILDISLIDSLIYTPESYFSFADENIL